MRFYSSAAEGRTPAPVGKIKSESREDYLKAIYELSGNGARSVRPAELAEHMGYARASVSRATNLLQREGYICINEEHGISLSELGRCEAESVYEKYCFFVRLLESVGVEREMAELEAGRLEHAICDESLNKLKLSLIKSKKQNSLSLIKG